MAKRGRKPKNKPADEGQQAQPAAEVQGNKTVSQVIFNKHREAILNAEAVKDAAVAKLRNAKKDAEADGIDVKDLDMLKKLEKLDPFTRKKRLANVAMYANWIDLPLGNFAVMNAANLDDEPRPEVNDHQAYQAGYDARKAGIPRDRNALPETAGNKRELWWNGWDDAERDIGAGKLQPTAAAA